MTQLEDAAERIAMEEHKRFRLYWRDGKTEVVDGRNIGDAMNNAGYGAGAIRALDFYGNTAWQSHVWDKVERRWVAC